MKALRLRPEVAQIGLPVVDLGFPRERLTVARQGTRYERRLISAAV